MLDLSFSKLQVKHWFPREPIDNFTEEEEICKDTELEEFLYENPEFVTFAGLQHPVRFGLTSAETKSIDMPRKYKRKSKPKRKKKMKKYNGRDLLILKLVAGATKAGVQKDQKKEDSKKKCRESVKEEE